VTGASALRADLRLFFRAAERNGYEMDDLTAFHFKDGWRRLPGASDHGSEDRSEGLYVKIQDVGGLSQLALDRRDARGDAIYLPLVQEHRP
jgi:hypothetical protein